MTILLGVDKVNNTKRSINFTIAFMTVISIFTFAMPNINLEFLGKNIDIVFLNLLFFLFIIVFPFIQFLLRILITSKYYIKDKLFFPLNMKSSKLYNRMIAYLAAVTLFLWPIITSKNLSLIKFSNIVSFIIWIFMIELLLYISYKYTKINFMSDGILIRGLDFRIDIPMGNELFNHSGFYPYYDIQSYSIKNNCLKLILYNNFGKIEGYISDEKIKPVSAFLESKEIRNIN